MEYFKPYPYRVKGLLRYESNAATSIYDSKLYRPFNLVKQHIDKGSPITIEVINSVLLKQKVSRS